MFFLFFLNFGYAIRSGGGGGGASLGAPIRRKRGRARKRRKSFTDAGVEPKESLPLDAVVHGRQIRLQRDGPAGARRPQVRAEDVQNGPSADGRRAGAALGDQVDGAGLDVELEARLAVRVRPALVGQLVADGRDGRLVAARRPQSAGGG